MTTPMLLWVSTGKPQQPEAFGATIPDWDSCACALKDHRFASQAAITTKDCAMRYFVQYVYVLALSVILMIKGLFLKSYTRVLKNGLIAHFDRVGFLRWHLWIGLKDSEVGLTQGVMTLPQAVVHAMELDAGKQNIVFPVH